MDLMYLINLWRSQNVQIVENQQSKDALNAKVNGIALANASLKNGKNTKKCAKC